MEVILHCGAHRCATTSFQNYLSTNARALKAQGVAYWGPPRTRKNGLNSLDQLTPDIQSALRKELDECARSGATQLLISQENFVGSMQRNVGYACLYPSVEERGQILARAFAGRVTRIGLNIRALDSYWTSVAAYLHKRGGAPIDPARWTRIAKSRRSWRNVITELGRAFPDVPLLVLPFEEFAGHPQTQLEMLLNRPVTGRDDNASLNGAPEPAPHGLNPAQVMKLWAGYADDLAWLAAGADGVAELMCNTKTEDCGFAPAEVRMEQRKPT